MRFGIMAMQIDYLLPKELRGQPVEQALATVMSFNQVNLASELAQHGFNLIEIGGDLAMLLPHTFQEEAVQELADLKEAIGLEFTVHLPLWSVEPSTLVEPVRKGSVEALVNIVQATRLLEPEIYVLHATGALAAEFYHMNLPETARAVLMRQFQNNARQSLQTILHQTGLPSRQIAIETIEFPFDLTVELAEELDLSICLDTGHVLAGFSGPIGLFEALERCLPRLGEVHLHDSPWQGPEGNITYGRDHQTLGAGDMDVTRFLKQLEKAGFDGPIIIELRLDQALESLKILERLSLL